MLLNARPILQKPPSAAAKVGCPVQRFATDQYRCGKRICADCLPIGVCSQVALEVAGRIRFYILLAKWSHARM